MKTLRLSPSGLLFALLIAACGGTAPTGVLTCEVCPGSAGHECTTFSGEVNDTMCNASCHVANIVASCPTAGVLGTCTYISSLPDSNFSATAVFYSDGGETEAQAEKDCLLGRDAHWTPH